MVDGASRFEMETLCTEIHNLIRIQANTNCSGKRSCHGRVEEDHPEWMPL